MAKGVGMKKGMEERAGQARPEGMRDVSEGRGGEEGEGEERAKRV